MYTSATKYSSMAAYTPNTSLPEHCLAGGGEMGMLMRSLDWAATPLGPVADWPQSLRTSVSICLNSRYPMLIWWGDEYIKLYNDAYRPLLGSTKHPRAMGQRGRECWPEIWDVIGPMLDGVMARGEATWSDDLMLPLERNGYIEECYFTFSYSPIRDESGGIGGVFTAVSETTERVIGERRLRTLHSLAARSAEARTPEMACRIAAETFADNRLDIPFTALYLIDHEDGRAHLVGSSGLTEPAAIAPTSLDLAPSSLPFHTVVETAQPTIVSLGYLPPPIPSDHWGEPVRQAALLPITSPGVDRVVGIAVVGISPRRALDNDYRSFLDLVIGQVSTAVTNARAYEEERKRAEELARIDRAKTDFFNNISHEFRTPLTLLLGPIEQAIAETKDTSSHERLKIAHRNGLRLLKLVNTLLDFSRVEAGRLHGTFEPTDLAALTVDLVGSFRSAIEQEGLYLTVDCPPLDEEVYVDREMWEKIVLNLLSNAFKFTFDGGITVRLRRTGDSAELSVCDSGTGISADELPKIFDRFHLIRGARARTYEGTGIGLALVQDLVGQHGGTVSAASTPGQGSCFTVRIPFGSQHLPQEQIGPAGARATSTPESSIYVGEASRWGTSHQPFDDRIETTASCGTDADQAGRRSRPTILVVDDNADMREYVAGLLHPHFDVRGAADGTSALELVRATRPDMIVTDVMMPGRDGFELLHELRADSRTRTIPIIILSARAGDEARIEGLEAGADDYLTKPFTAGELLARVNTNLTMAQIRNRAAEREQTAREESQRASERLSEMLALVDAFLATAPMGAGFLDRDLRYIRVNDRLAAVDGIPVEDHLGRRFHDLLPEMAERFAPYMQHVLDTGESVLNLPVEGEAPDRPDEHRHWLVSYYPVRLHDGEIAGVGLILVEVTESKRMLETLRDREERLRSIVDTAPDVIYTVSADGMITSLSPAFEKLTGWPTSEWIGRSFTSIVHPDDLMTAVHQLYTILNGESPAPFELRILTSAGEYRIAELRSRPHIQNDRIVGTIGIARDINDRIAAEQTIRENERRLRRLIESNIFGVAFGNFNGRLIAANDYMLRTIGYSPEELLAGTIPWRAMTPPEYIALDRHATEELKRTGVCTPYEKELTRSDGSRVPILIGGAMLDEPYDTTDEIVIFALDLTEQKRATVELQKSTELLAEAQRIGHIGSWEWEIATDVVTWSDELYRIYGLDGSNFVPTFDGFLDRVHPDDREQVREIVEASFGSEEPFRFHHRIVRPDGRVRVLRAWGRVWSDAEGQPVRMTGAGQDVTEARQAEEEIKRLNTELEQRVADRTAQLEASNRELEAFAYSVSHDLRAPLRSIDGFCKILLDDYGPQLDDEGKEYLQRIRKASQRLGQLIDDLLNLSRATRTTMRIEHVDLSDMALHIAEELRSDEPNRSAEFRIDLGAIARGDARLLQLVMQNLLDNAWKFSSKNEQARIEFGMTEEEGGRVFFVRDNGVGFDMKYADRLFTSFQRLHSPAQFPGSGIGLATVHRIVKRHGGTIWVKAGEGKGATFYFTL